MAGSNGATIDLGSADSPIDPAAALNGGTGNSTDGVTGTIRDSGGTAFDPAIHSGPDKRNADGSFTRKRGRKSGSGGGSTRSRSSVHSDIKETAQFLAQGLLLFHTSMAAMTNTPELVLDGDEAQGLAESGLTLASLYEIQPDPKLQAAILFAGQVGMIYGTRIVAIRARKATEKKATSEKRATVHPADGSPISTTEYHTQEWPLNQSEPTPGGLN